MVAIGLGQEGSGVRPADLLTFKQDGRPIAALTAWDALSAALVELAGADVILVGDSLAMVVLGHPGCTHNSHHPELSGLLRLFRA